LTRRFFQSLHLILWAYFLYALQEELWGLKKSAVSKLLAPYGEGIFDGLRESEPK
jgi:hypothetical protein